MHNLDRCLCRTRDLFYVGQDICFIRIKDSFNKDHMWSWWKHPVDKLELIASG